MMRKVFAVCLILSAGTLSAGVNTPKSAKWPIVSSILQIELVTWARTPTASATCGSASPAQECCETTIATGNQCTLLAREVTAPGQAAAVASGIAGCIAASGNWKCDLYIEEGEAKLDCQTVPGLLTDGALSDPANLTTSDGARLSDVALCASTYAASRYSAL